MTNIDNIDDKLREKGLRATAQRLMICREIDKAGHIEIESLYESLKKQIPSLSIATIYKNMHSLAEKEIITEVNVSGKKTMYELNIDPHIHLVCSECGNIEDIPFDTIKLVSNIKELSDRKISECKLTTVGICSKCLG
ncbi:ferric uptake regulator, Fur family [Denitrovibrio acetiphilus DSM 12809]|uniref:Ferric uptake regulator, Fur family n=1 Tax=Denitrovibrio acetiphilus (strain DSM 12809 / NBRC 114555 / N2460) TaxID=522772 RepID=D4H7F3_DENA2|nr:Fur family transcriptional regulator [Denitrovibrio acetiphilus]ADD67952.1 ferric uptake regulator, Fur family [Denitrovibrio acetiphilus DSM 12809]